MQTAEGPVTLSPENIQVKRNLTPAEVLILSALHRSNAQGAVVTELTITGEAMETVNGKTRPRTNTEEVLRLKRQYTGIVKGVRAFEAVFGSAHMVSLPQTFEEIQSELGNVTIHSTKPEAPAEEPANESAEGYFWRTEDEEEFNTLLAVHDPSKKQLKRLQLLQELRNNSTNLKN